MMGTADAQPEMCHTVQLEDLVPAEHPLRKIRPLIETTRIRQLCAPFYCPDNGRPSIPPEQLFLALVGGYLLGVRSDRKLIMELQCNMAFRWFVGLDITDPVWDASTFSKNREHRFDASGVLEALFDDTVKVAITRGLVSTHWSVDGTLVRADASHKSFAPIEVYQSPQQYRQALRATPPTDPGNPTVNWRGQKRSNATHRSTTDPDARLARKSSNEGAIPAYTVNGVMENRHRLLVGIGVEQAEGPHAEREGSLRLLTRAKRRLKLKPSTVGGDKGFFERASSKGCCVGASSRTSRSMTGARAGPTHGSAAAAGCGLPVEPTSPEEDRGVVGRGQRGARIPPILPANAGQRPPGGVDDGLAAQSEAVGSPFGRWSRVMRPPRRFA